MSTSPDNHSVPSAVATRIVTLPCPRCGNYSVVHIPLVTSAGEFNHCRYICNIYESGRRSPCGWEGWTVPGWDES